MFNVYVAHFIIPFTMAGVLIAMYEKQSCLHYTGNQSVVIGLEVTGGSLGRAIPH